MKKYKKLFEANKFEKYENEDFQNREKTGAFPKSDIPDAIYAQGNGLEFLFKSTDQRTAENFVKKYCLGKKLKVKKISSRQDGDYEDDWVSVSAIIG